MSEEIERKLDLLIALQRIAHRESLRSLEEEMLSDEITREIVKRCATWIDAGDLKRAVEEKARTSKPTVERRVAELVADGVLERSGSGAHVRYRTTGLIRA